MVLAAGGLQTLGQKQRRRKPVCVSVINMKGGVGKTTIAALLGRHAASRLQLDVLAIDLDPQANLSQALMPYNYEDILTSKSPSVAEIFSGYRPPSVGREAPTPLEVEDVTINTSGLQLIASRFDFSDHLVKSLKPDPQIIARYISDNFQEKDLIIIDCAPTESVFTQVAYHASRHVLVPVRPEYFATIGFPLLKQSLTKFRQENRGHKISVIGVVINNGFYYGGNDGGPEKSKALEEIAQQSQKNRWHIFENQIPHSRGFPKMMRGDFTYPGNAVEFGNFAEEFFYKAGF